MTKNWKINFRRMLSSADAPRVADTKDLAALAKRVGLDAPAKSAAVLISRLVGELEEQRILTKVRRGLYLNRMCEPRATLAEAAQRLRPGCIVSLATVLGDAGVLNNYTHEVTAVVPTDPSQPSQPSLGRQAFGQNVFRFHGIASGVLDACDPEDALELGYPYPRATKEAAFAHWVYLAASPNGGISQLPPDIDADLLDRDRLSRISAAMDVAEEVEEWIETARRYEEGLTGPTGHPF